MVLGEQSRSGNTRNVQETFTHSFWMGNQESGDIITSSSSLAWHSPSKSWHSGSGESLPEQSGNPWYG